VNAELSHLLDRFTQSFLVHVGQRDAAFLAPELNGKRTADARARACDGGHLMFEAFHD
jgi:hypothetical protein